MKKFISAATCLAMAASMVSVAAPAVNAADATKTITLAAYKDSGSAYASMGSNIKVDQSAIDAGDVTIPVAIYLTEESLTSEILTLPVTIKSKSGADVSGITYKTYNAKEKYFSSAKSYTTKEGVKFSTNAAVPFDAMTDDMDEYATYGKLVPVSDTKQTSFGIDTPYYCVSWIGGGGYKWFGDKSDDYPVAVFDVVLPKGTKAGDYSLEFADLQKPGYDESLLNIAGNDGTTYDNFAPGANKLITKNMTITVGEGTEPTSEEVQPTSEEIQPTSEEVQPTTGEVTDSDLTLDFGKYEVDAGGSVNVDIKLKSGDVAVSGMDVFYKIDSPLKITGFGSSSGAYNASVDKNADTLEQNFFAVGSDGEPVKGEVGSSVLKVKVSVPADCPTGDYKIDFKTCEVYKSGQNSDTWKTNVIPGVIHVNGTGEVSQSSSEEEQPTTGEVTDSDLTLDFGSYEGEAGGSVNVDIKLKSGDVAVSGMDVFYKIDSPLKITGFGSSSAAYNASVDKNADTLEQNFFAVGSDGEPVKGEVGASVLKVKVSIPEGTPAGTYTIDFKTCEVYKSGQNSDTWKVNVIPGKIVVGGGETTTAPETTTTTAPETTTTTSEESTTAQETTTTAEPTKPTTELTPNYGDTNLDGDVNIADVVILNRYLADKDYTLTEQAMLNGDVYDPKGGKDLTTDDSTSILRHIIHIEKYKTFPIDPSKL